MPQRIVRKLQVLGGSFLISLPKKWIKNYKLDEDKNLPLTIDVRDDGMLLISPKLLQYEEDIKDELVLDLNPHIGREIVKHCLTGIESLVIISDKEIGKEVREEIKWFVKGLPNTEIIEDDRQRIVITNFGFRKIPTFKLIQRQLYIIVNMFENIKEGQPEKLKEDFKELKRFYFILVTHIRTYLRTGIYVTEDNDFTPLEAMDYRIFCEKIEEIGKILRDFRLNNNQEVKKFFLDIESYYDKTLNAYLKKDLILLRDVWYQKDELITQAELLMDDLNHEDKEKIKDLLRIADHCKDMGALI